MKIKFRTLFIILIVVLLLTKCKSAKKEYYISNPTNTEISLVLDSKEYKIKPQSFEKIKLKVGKHNLKTNKGENVNFIVYYDSTGGVINPTRDSYILFTQIYGSLTTSSGAMLRESTLKIGPMQTEMVAEVSNNIIIDRNLYDWYYNLGEKLPDSVVGVKTEKQDTREKIFTRKEFVEFIEEMEKTKLPPENVNIILNEKITVNGQEDTYNEVIQTYAKGFTVPNYNTEGLKELVEKMENIRIKYSNSTKAGEQKKLKKQMNKLMEESTKLNKSYAEKDSGKNPYYSPFLYMKQGTIIVK